MRISFRTYNQTHQPQNNWRTNLHAGKHTNCIPLCCDRRSVLALTRAIIQMLSDGNWHLLFSPLLDRAHREAILACKNRAGCCTAFLLPAFAILLVVPITPVVIVASASTMVAGVSPPRAIIVFFFLLIRMACASLLPLMFFKLFLKSSSLGSGICRWRRERGNRPGRVCARLSATPHFTAQRVNGVRESHHRV